MTMASWQDLAPGAVITEPGNSQELETGSWRLKRPVVDLDRCVHCMICWIFCPDNCFIIQGGRLTDVDYPHCKGCGICAVECPRKCIEMVED